MSLREWAMTITGALLPVAALALVYLLLVAGLWRDDEHN